MIRIKFFPNKNSFRNLWGLLGDVTDELNAHLETYGARGTQGINVGPQGVYVTSEDGVFSKSLQLDVLYGQKIKNDTQMLTQAIIYNSLTRKMDEASAEKEKLEKELQEMTEGLKDKSDTYKDVKPKIDETREHIKHLESVIQNAATQIIPVKGDMDRIAYENAQIEKMIEEVC